LVPRQKEYLGNNEGIQWVYTSRERGWPLVCSTTPGIWKFLRKAEEEGINRGGGTAGEIASKKTPRYSNQVWRCRQKSWIKLRERRYIGDETLLYIRERAYNGRRSGGKLRKRGCESEKNGQGEGGRLISGTRLI